MAPRLSRLCIVALASLGVAGCDTSSSYDLTSMSDQIAMNSEDSGAWQIIGEQRTDNILITRVRVARMASAERIAIKILQQRKNLGYADVRIEVIGPDDPNTATPRVVSSLAK